MIKYIIGAICIIVTCIIGYYLYNKISSQQETISQLISRYKLIESVLTRPQPRQEINSLFSQQKVQDCDDCMIIPVKSPMILEQREDEIDIVENIDKDIPEPERDNTNEGIIEEKQDS